MAALVEIEDFPTGELDVRGPEQMTVMDLQDRLLGLAGRRKVKLHVMASVATLGAWLAERTFRDPPVTVGHIEWMLDEHVPKRSAARKLLGRRPEAFERAFPGFDSLPEGEGRAEPAGAG